MNKKLLALLAILLCVTRLTANPVDEATARVVAGQFALTSLTSTSRAEEMHLVMETEDYFVFNVGETGFVIVSSDDRFRPIVGYSEEGVFPTENPSPEMMYYLNSLGQGRQAALRSFVEADEQVKAEWSALLNGEIMPSRNGNRAAFHLVQTKWNQNAPYNKFCPKAEGQGRAYAGCVATAMSQVMNYWKHPAHGYGQHSYTYAQYGTLSADFSSAVYDFDLMPNSIGVESPVENIDAVAMFMYHCGIAVDMMYGPDGSGAYSYDVPEAVMKYFDYTNRCRYYSRNSYSLEDFQRLLKDQFDMGWPCYYSGQDTDGNGGHAFVCDGYDNNDMFHFNWGWSGSGDGFFAIDELNVSSYAFNDDQGVIVNFVPSEVFLHTASAPEFFTATPNGDMNLSVTLSWINPSTTLDGQTLEAIDQIVIMRDKKVIHTIDNPSPGDAMSYVDPSGPPITVNYSAYAISQGYEGRWAYANGINLGPACEWTVNLLSENSNGLDGGVLTFVNSSGIPVAELTAVQGENTFKVEIPQGWISMKWTAPDEMADVGIEILDSDDHQVFAFLGLSSSMPRGIFYKTVNTCGGESDLLHPSDLTAQVVDNDVALNWTGVQDPGYGYAIYRDGLLYDMVSDTTCFIDTEMAHDAHSYFVTAFRMEGETDPSNTVCAILDDDLAPRNLDAEIMENNKIKLTWERPLNDTDLSGYTVYRKALGEDFRRLKICSSNATEYTDNFYVEDGNYYIYRVTAINKREYVDSSPARSLRHPDLLYVEINRTHLPSGLTLEEQSDGQVLLKWDPAMLAETYNVYCNGVLLAQDLTEPQYVAEAHAEGELLVYYVTGLLNGVESSPSNRVYYGNYAVVENTLFDMVLFPNPAKDAVTVYAEGLQEITVFNMTGQKLLRRRADNNELTIDLSDLPSRVYYFNVAADQGIQVRKVVLVK